MIKTTAKETRSFLEIETELKQLLNSKGKAGYNKAEKVLILLREFENSKGFKMSKEYLKGLYENKTKNQIRSNLSFLLKDLNILLKEQNNYFNEFVFKKFETIAISHNYSKRYKVGLSYFQKAKKTFNIIVTNPDEVRQINQNKQEMFLRSLGQHPELILSYFFNLS